MVQPLASEIYTAHLHITGGREGHGRSSDGVLDLQLATPGTGKPGTNPEQLFGIGYSACFLSAMHIGALQQKFRLPKEASVNADVTLGKTAAGDYQLKLVLNIDLPGVDEGMSGISTRFAYKILSKVFNFDSAEVAANPVHLMYVLEQQIEREQFPAELEQKYLGFIKEHLSARYAEFIGKEIQTAYLESYSEYGQNIFDRYVTYADYWIQDQEYRDTDTGEVFDRSQLNAELEKIEKPAGISNPKDFRNEIVNFVLRARANNNGKNPLWTSYEKLRTVIEKKMFSNTEELLPVISFNAKASADEAKKHENFVNRMVEKGYTAKQVRLLCEWYLRVRKSS